MPNSNSSDLEKSLTSTKGETPTPDSYEEKLAAWKARQGLPFDATGEVDHVALMVAEDAKRKGKDYCGHCAEPFAIADMRLVTRKDDPYIQYDEDEPSNRPDWYIQVQHRVRMCKPCFKHEYEDGDGDDAHCPSRNQGEGD